MKISQMKQILKVHHLANDAVRMVGKHGMGKSQIVEQFAKENNYHIETLFLSQNEVADLIGIPIQENGVTYWSKPVWLKRMEDASKEGRHCVLFLDELSRAPLEVRQSALQLVLEGRIHEHKLPEKDGLRTLIVAADNPSDEYQTDELDPALLDRFGNYEVEVDVQGWLNWARKNSVNPVIMDYVAEFPDKLHFLPEDDTDKGATPRSWAKLSAIVSNFNEIDKGLQYSVIVSKIGSVVGSSFFHYYNNYIKVLKPEDIEKMLKGKNLKTEEGIIEAAKEISEKTQKLEAISAVELANKMKEKARKSKKWNNILTTYLESLNVEICVSIIKTWKEGSEDEKDSEFYFDWASTVPNAFLFRKILKVRDENNNK